MASRAVTEKKLRKYTRHFGNFCEECLFIKDENAEISPLLIRNRYIQRTIAEYLVKCWLADEPIRLIILKPRRGGVSTIVNAFYFWLTALGFNTNCYILSHDVTGVSYLFDMHKLFYDNLDPDIRPMKRHDNAGILRFENPNDADRDKNPGRRSEIRVGGMNSKKTGSGYTTHLAHFSELAKADKPEEIMTSMKPSVPKPPKFSSVIIESTAYGAGNYFHTEWQRAKNHDSEYKAMFFAWFHHEEYTMKVPDGFTRTAREDALAKKYKLDDGRLVWRRYIIRNECDGDEDIFKQEYPSNDVEAFLVTGRSVFAPSTLDWYEMHEPDHIWEGELDILTTKRGEVSCMEKEAGGRLKIYEDPRKPDGKHYCLGADVAEGIDMKTKDKRSQGDRSSFHIFNRQTGALAAKWVGWLAPDMYGKMLYAIGKYFNWAYLGVEANNHGLTVLHVLKEMDYPMNQMYHRTSYGDEDDEYSEQLGWYTSKKTKALMVDTFAAALREHEIGCFVDLPGGEKEFYGLDDGTIGELRTFTKDAKGRTGGTQGCYDDQVISACLAWMMVTECRIDSTPVKALPKGLKEFNAGHKIPA